MSDAVGAALAEAFEHLPNRDELLAEISETANRHLEDPTNYALRQTHTEARTKTRVAQARKALELGLIPQHELDRIEREASARRAIFIAMNN